MILNVVNRIFWEVNNSNSLLMWQLSLKWGEFLCCCCYSFDNSKTNTFHPILVIVKVFKYTHTSFHFISFLTAQYVWADACEPYSFTRSQSLIMNESRIDESLLYTMSRIWTANSRIIHRLKGQTHSTNLFVRSNANFVCANAHFIKLFSEITAPNKQCAN